jgi:hypothetical protein
MAEDGDGPAGLTGTWHGHYMYPAARDPVPFTANLIDREGQIGGSVTETATSRRIAGTRLYATIAGHYSGATVVFTKTYEANEGGYTEVAYEGRLSADRLEIAGVWRLVDWSGRFVMRRPGKLKKAAEQRVSLLEPV